MILQAAAGFKSRGGHRRFRRREAGPSFEPFPTSDEQSWSDEPICIGTRLQVGPKESSFSFVIPTGAQRSFSRCHPDRSAAKFSRCHPERSIRAGFANAESKDLLSLQRAGTRIRIRAGFPHSADRSSQVGFSRSMSMIFFSRRHRFNCFSRPIATSTHWNCS